MYLIFSASKQGWVTPTSTYSSDRNDAKRFTRENAILACQLHRDQRSGALDWILISEKDIEALEP